MIHGSCVALMGSDLSIQRGLITLTDVYRRTDMHHDYMTSLLHCICLIFVCDVWIVSVYPSFVEFDLLALIC